MTVHPTRKLRSNQFHPLQSTAAGAAHHPDLASEHHPKVLRAHQLQIKNPRV